MNRDDCIKELEEIISNQKNKDRATGAAFNLLEIAHINRDEVRICRILHSIINPKGEHLMEDKFFKIFANNVLGLKDDEIGHPEVTREEHTDNNRRADIFIKTDKWLIPIEVKIDAEDQYEQCKDYYDYAVEKAPDNAQVRLYYLTKNGKKPSSDSAKELLDDNRKTKCISFNTDIVRFLDKCIYEIKNERLKVSFEILKDAIKGFCNSESKITQEIITKIKNNDENFKNAVSVAADNSIVSDCLDIIRRDLIKRYFDKVQKELGGEWNTYKESEISKQVYTCGDYQLSVYFVIYPEKYWFDKKEWKGKPVIGIQVWRDSQKVLNDELKELRNKLEKDMNIELLSSFKYNWIYRKFVSEEYDFLDFAAKGNRIFELIREDENNKLDDLVERTVDAINNLLNPTAS